jgi:hypothetical protein
MQRTIRLLPLVSAVILFLASIYYATRQDFGAYLSMFVVLPSLVCIVLLCMSQARRLPHSKLPLRAAVLLTVLSPVAMVTTWYLLNPIAFYRWSASHAALLAQDSTRDHVIAGWKTREYAGNEWNDYLIRATGNDISSTADAEKWRQKMQIDCEIVGEQKVARQIYIVTTYNCPIAGIDMPAQKAANP